MMSRRDDRLREAAEIHVKIGQLRRYCELMVQLGQVECYMIYGTLTDSIYKYVLKIQTKPSGGIVEASADIYCCCYRTIRNVF